MKYRCRQCDKVTSEPGNCPTCNIPMQELLQQTDEPKQPDAAPETPGTPEETPAAPAPETPAAPAPEAPAAPAPETPAMPETPDAPADTPTTEGGGGTSA